MEANKQATAAKTAAAAAEAKPKSGKQVCTIFATHPQLDVYYRASDGTPFFTRNAAEQHAAGLSDKEVKKVTR